MDFNVATIWIAVLLTTGIFFPLKVTVSGVSENSVPVIVSCLPERVVPLMVEADTVAAVSSQIVSAIAPVRIVIDAPSAIDFCGADLWSAGEGTNSAEKY